MVSPPELIAVSSRPMILSCLRLPSLIISASCFIRSSDRMYKWVTEHKLFGSLVKDYLETGAIPQKIKYIAISCIWIASFISTVSIYLSEYDYFYILLIILLALASIGTWFIASRPTKY